MPAAKHGMHKDRVYKNWINMRMRCQDPGHHRYYLYGARGVKVCERWDKSFEAFYEDMGPRPSPDHTIDQINSNGDYEPGNCRWATKDEQRNNRRNTKYVIYRGERMSLFDAVQKAGGLIRTNVAWHRLRIGWSVEETVETPLLPRNAPKRLKRVA